ncbi:DUF2381 family protein [Corallococcus macrosporus]|uniref:DUF2381 family protein n=1 Tax=Corallococcus macrosporus DSM 14697 TaxID=1189310 RepID=A0A250K4P1_9BACT|nr:DUF2381 family protein [Corallococcus macrosporus]ATB50983.1 hypothetical protein MYMAC_006640 [Corallococcus macrosporus DSM 14697]
MNASAAVLLVHSLLTTQTAAPPLSTAAPWAPAARRLTVGLQAPRFAAQPLEVRISPGVGTLLLFDTPVARAELENEQRFTRVRLAGDTLTLMPSASVEDSEALRLTVHFADGAAPASATFRLVPHPTLADRQVEIHRHARSADSLHAELLEKEGEVRRLREELVRMEAARSLPDGLTGMLAIRHLDKNGVRARWNDEHLLRHPRNTLKVRTATTYRAAARVAVAVECEELRGGAPWEARGATLVPREGAALRVLRVWQEAPTAAGIPGQFIVEAEATDTMSPGPYTLTVWAEGDKRSVILGNVMFP